MLNRIFPVCKFARVNTKEKQLYHIRTELLEAGEHIVDLEGNYKNPIIINQELLDEELMDVIHSIETYFAIREREGLDVDALIQKVIEKNRTRGYYEEG